MSEQREALTSAIRDVTDQWDEPLDEVHDVPLIVNAVLAAGFRKADVHICAECSDCIHDGHKCCGCYDNACCQPTHPTPTTAAGDDGEGVGADA